MRTTSTSRWPWPIPFGWFAQCWSVELEPGALVARRAVGRDLVLWRDEAGKAHVQDAYCPHLGAHLAVGGKVSGCEVECPF
ncbi:MAG TPA: Rieske 2Fe-2S domain-containing protein, partial [Acidimicrobiales bacterium]